MKRRTRQAVLMFVLTCLAAGSAMAIGTGEKAKVQGMIATRTADTLTVNVRGGEPVIVVLDDNTKCQMPKGLGVRKEKMSAAALIPGLNVVVEGVGDDQGRLVAKTITFSKDDLEAAEAIQAGLTVTNQRMERGKQAIQKNQQDIAANRAAISENTEAIEAANQRFDNLTEFDQKGELTINFKAGSSALTKEHKASLSKLAADAANLKGYIVQVKGFADSSGNAAMNQKLSMDRALNVVAYLLQECNVPQRRIVAPGAMGESNPAAGNETPTGRANNRRVEVKILVNKGLASTK